MTDDLDSLLETKSTRTSPILGSGGGGYHGGNGSSIDAGTGLNLFPQEQVLIESDGKTLLLTTHRLRYDAQRIGSGEVISIMLEELSSSAIIRRSKPFLLALGGIFLLFGIYLQSQQNSYYSNGMNSAIGFVPAIGFIIAYFLSRRQVLEFASAGAAIRVNTSSMSLETVRSFINQTETAKNNRYLTAKNGTA